MQRAVTHSSQYLYIGLNRFARLETTHQQDQRDRLCQQAIVEADVHYAKDASENAKVQRQEEEVRERLREIVGPDDPEPVSAECQAEKGVGAGAGAGAGLVWKGAVHVLSNGDGRGTRTE